MSAEESTNPAFFQRAMAEVERLLEADEAARSSALDQLAREDPELAGEVGELLGRALSDSADGELVARARSEAARLFEEGAQDLPERVGRYRILGLLGRGGMGVVYRAAQEQPSRELALKLLPAFAATPALAARFEREAQALARLSHHGIARIYDAGIDREGGSARHWIAMELIEGRSITEHAEFARLELHARVLLLVAVCEAVAHAHAKGVLHRDLKPTNVLVGEDGRPRVLDFGVARLFEGEGSTERFDTAEGQLVGTLAYMSPEQAAGTALDARSDVYALGLLGYELFTGRRAQAVTDMPLARALLVVQETEPQPAGALDRRLRGDLETILATALAKPRARRYPSAEALAADLRRYLASEPIAARPPSTVYQLSKFARRHRALVGGAAGILAALLLGLVGTSVQAARATRQAELARANQRRAEDATRVLLELFRAGQSHQPEGQRPLVEIVSEGRGALETAFLDAPRERAELLGALGEALLYGGKHVESRELLLEALELESEHAPQGGESNWRLHFCLGSAAQQMGLLAEAEHHLQRTLELLHPGGDDGLANTRRQACSNLALLLCERGAHDEAVTYRAQALELARTFEPRSVPQLAFELSSERFHVEPTDDAFEALRARFEEIDLERLPPDARASLCRDAGEPFLERGRAQQDGELLERALRLLEESAFLFQRLVGREGALAATLLSLSMGEQARGDLQATLALRLEAVRLLAAEHFPRSQRASAHLALGASLSALGDFEGALHWLERAHAASARAGPDDYLVLAEMYQRAERHDRAADVLCALKGRILEVGAPELDRLESIDARLAVSSLLAGNAVEAAALFTELLAERRKRGALPSMLASSEQLLGWALLRLGRVDQAEPLVLAGSEATLAISPSTTARGQLCVRSLIELHEARGRTDEAQRWRAQLLR